MKITKRQLRKIIRESIMIENEKAESSWEENRRLLRTRTKSHDLPESDQERLRSEYESEKDNAERYVRVSTPDMTDAVYGRGRGRGRVSTTVWDKKENTLLSWTRSSGSGGSLGT